MAPGTGDNLNPLLLGYSPPEDPGHMDGFRRSIYAINYGPVVSKGWCVLFEKFS